MSRVKIEDLKPEARKLDAKEMKKLFGGLSCYIESAPNAIQTQESGVCIAGSPIQLQESGIIDRSISSAPAPEAGPAPTKNLIR
jgi:hypothetical protein